MDVARNEYLLENGRPNATVRRRRRRIVRPDIISRKRYHERCHARVITPNNAFVTPLLIT